MGANLQIRTLHDLERHGFHLGIQCLNCDHSGIYAVRGVIEWFMAKRWNMALEASGGRFRCSKCQHKGARLKAVAPYKAPDLPTLQPSRYTLRERARRERS